MENLKKSGNFCLFKAFFHILFVSASSLSVYMPGNFTGLSKMFGKCVKKSGNFDKLSLEKLESKGILVKEVLRAL